ncbi:hypothetical protein [Nocardia puris]|uniref:hypothetical protein n=1 Tax=Nocardia puris TaxID=208602 RepID=UPI002E1ACA05
MPVRYELHGVQYPDQPRTVWRFGDPECPLRLAETPKGLGGAQFGHIRQSNARELGATWRGLKREINPVTLTVRVGPVQPGAVALDLWNAWRLSLGTGSELAEFHVISPGGGDRYQFVRRENAVPDATLDLLETVGELTETVVLASDESPWRGATVNPPPFAPTEWAGKTIRNDGDFETWPFWRLTGPGVFSIGVGDEAVTLPMIPAGTHWTVETNPQYPHIHDAAGVDVWEQAGNVGWYQPVPAKTTVPLNMSGTGTSASSRVEVWLPQLYEWAVA